MIWYYILDCLSSKCVTPNQPCYIRLGVHQYQWYRHVQHAVLKTSKWVQLRLTELLWTCCGALGQVEGLLLTAGNQKAGKITLVMGGCCRLLWCMDKWNRLGNCSIEFGWICWGRYFSSFWGNMFGVTAILTKLWSILYSIDNWKCRRCLSKVCQPRFVRRLH